MSAEPSPKPALPDGVAVLEHEGATYYLVGTVHVSETSVREVGEVIEAVQPDIVAIELCQGRYKALVEESSWTDLDIFKVIRSGKTLFLLGNLAIGAYQRRLGEKLGVKPGSEFVEAARRAKQLGARVELIDRDIHVTLKRTWGNLGFWKKSKVLGSVIAGLFERSGDEEIQIDELRQQANLSEMLQELARVLPELKKPLIDERDQYMISKAVDAGGERVVVVVGAAHVPGMTENLGKEVDREVLEQIPPPTTFMRVMKWILPVLFLSAFSYGYFKHRGAAADMLLAWVIANSAFAAAFTAIAGAKILSILTAAVASPVTSLNPLLPAGVVVGLMEAWRRKPTVEDCERINDDVKSVRGVYRNAVTRVLLVAFMATMGSAIGAWVGISWVVSFLA